MQRKSCITALGGAWLIAVSLTGLYVNVLINIMESIANIKKSVSIIFKDYLYLITLSYVCLRVPPSTRTRVYCM